MDHPIQPLVKDKIGTVRFKRNRIVDHLLTAYSQNTLICDSSRICRQNSMSPNDWRDDYDQLMQLIGYSVSGAPISEACRARVPEFDVEPKQAPTFTEGFRAGFAQAKRDALLILDSELECK